MRSVSKLYAVTTGLVLTAMLCGSLLAAAAKPAPAAPDKPAGGAGGAEVTLKGLVMSEFCCTFKKGDEGTAVIFAAEGTPEVAQTWDEIMKTCWPGDSMDAGQAKKMRDMVDQKLKYYITPGGPIDGKKFQFGNPAKALTGVVSEKDGKKWLTVSAQADVPKSPQSEVAKFKYPDKMYLPDKPIQPSGKTPLVLKIGDNFSLTCILVPCGKFEMGAPFFCGPPRWQDEPPHVVTLTKPFYLAEIPVTQEMYESVMGNNPSTAKGPQFPVRNVPCGDMYKFCQMLSQKNGNRAIRLPTQAEWEWACRVGVSNPPFVEKFKDQEFSTGRGSGTPVKSKKPNAWGFYDMAGDVYEITRDAAAFFTVDDAVDQWAVTDCSPAGKKHGHMAKGKLKNKLSNHEIAAKDNPMTDASYGSYKFRLLIEATPDEIAALAKANGK